MFKSFTSTNWANFWEHGPKQKIVVRQRCVVSPLLSCLVVHMARDRWKCHRANAGFDFGEGLARFLGFRLANDILVLLLEMVRKLQGWSPTWFLSGAAGEKWNVDKMVVVIKRRPAATDPWYSKWIVFKHTGATRKPKMTGLHAHRWKVLRIVRLIFGLKFHWRFP